MELRVLRYFLTVAEEKSFTGAANRLHVTQPTLSRQIRDLEEELGADLFLRGKRKIELTEAGLFLRRRAGEILELAAKTRAAFAESETGISGDVSLGGGETDAMRLVARTVRKVRQRHPNIRFHIFSGNAEDVAERLDRGLVDFGIFIRPANLEKYEYLSLPVSDVWGLLIRKDDPLAARTSIRPQDLAALPLICSRQTMVANELAGWMGEGFDRLTFVATYNLLYNAALMVEEGIGVALCLDGIADTSDTSQLCFRPLEPALKVGLDVAWKKRQVFSRAAAEFRAFLQREIAGSVAQP